MATLENTAREHPEMGNLRQTYLQHVQNAIRQGEFTALQKKNLVALVRKKIGQS